MQHHAECLPLPFLLPLLCAIGLSPPNVEGQTESVVAGADELAVPAGLPDYATMTGYVADAALPKDSAMVHWKLVSSVRVRSIEAGENTFEMIPFTGAVVGDGVVYFANRAAPGEVFALSSVDGSEVWRYKHSAAGISVPPSVDEDHIYFESDAGITALRRDSGDVAWHFDVQHGGGESPPIPIGDRVYFSGYDGKAYALNQADGRVIWSRSLVEDAPPDPPDFPGERARFQQIAARPRGAACDGEVFVQSLFDQSRIVALDCATGELRWSFQARGWIDDPTIAGKRVYVGSQDKHLYCLDRETGDVVWKFLAPTWLASQVAVHDGRVYLPVHGPRLYQLDAASGEVLWVFAPKVDNDRTKAVYSFPTLTDDTAYFAAGEGQFYAVDITTGELRWKLRPSDDSELFTDPVTDGRRIFVTCRQGLKNEGECAVIAIGAIPVGE